MAGIELVSGKTIDVEGSGKEIQDKLDAATNTYGSGRGVLFKRTDGRGTARINPGKWAAIIDPDEQYE